MTKAKTAEAVTHTHTLIVLKKENKVETPLFVIEKGRLD